jgi:hypothetical protein
MKDDIELYAIDEQGDRLLGSVLEPFWKTISSAFSNKANVITVRANRLNAGDVDVNYQKEGKIVPLSLANDFHPFISSSRIRIISGMVINPNLTQTGKVRVRFGKDVLTLDVKIEIENDYEILRLKPHWE